MKKFFSFLTAFIMVLVLFPSASVNAAEGHADNPGRFSLGISDREVNIERTMLLSLDAEDDPSRIETETSLETTELIVKADDIAPEYSDNVTSIIGDYAILSFDNAIETNEAYSEYAFHKGSFIERPAIVEACDTDASSYNAISRGYESMHFKAFNQALINKYGSVDSIPETKVAIIDTGVDYTHEFIMNRVDKHDFDYITDDGDAMDEESHGTHVAGIVADSTLPNVRIYAYRVLDEYGYGTDAGVAAAIVQAVNDGVDVINMSLRFPSISTIMNEAMDIAIASDVIIVAAAGNDSADCSSISPASYAEAITVSATDGNNTFENYSNFGQYIDIAATGSGIVSSVLGNTYEAYSGTSMSAPYVAGAAASLKAYLYSNKYSYLDLSHMLKLTAKDLGTPGVDTLYGYGLLDMQSLANFVSSPSWQWSGVTKAPVITESDNANGTKTVSITASSGAAIYFTVDGSYPTANGSNASTIIYTGPFELSANTKISAVAKESGRYESSASFLSIYFNDDAIESDFVIAQDGTLISYNGIKQIVRIPDVINGIKVRKIGDLFLQNTTISELYIPDTVTTIGYSGLSYSNIKRIHFGKNVREIGFQAFYGNRFLTEITVDPANPYLVSDNNVLYSKDYTHLYSANAYANIGGNRSLYIHDGCKYMHCGAFWGSYLEKVYMPASVEDFYYKDGYSVGDQSIAEFIAAPDSPYYSSENGALYNKDKTILYGVSRYCQYDSFVVPETVQEINEGAFFYCCLDEIIFQNGLRKIGTAAFEGNHTNTFYIPATLNHLEPLSFYMGSSRPVNLYFEGDAPATIYRTLNNGEEANIYRYPNKKGFERFLSETSTKVFDLVPDYTVRIRAPKGMDVNVDGIDFGYTYQDRQYEYTINTDSKSHKTVSAFELNASGSPIGMKVWTLQHIGGRYQAIPRPEFDDLISYSGFSIRIRGVSGIRYSASIPTELKGALASENGVNGFKLREYGVVALPESYLTNYPLIRNGEYVSGTMDYRKYNSGAVYDNVFSSEKGLDTFTGLLKNIPVKGYNTNIAFRSYIMLDHGNQSYIFYQKPVVRSIYYLASQYINRNMYSSDSYEYEYLMNIINSVNNQ